MKTPSYSWVCHKCQAVNPAGVSACAQCEFPAFADGRAIASAQPKPVVETAPQGEHWLVNSSAIWLFFPEIVPAIGVVVASPFRLLSLLAAGKLAAAAVLFLGVAAVAGLAYAGFKSKSQFVVWLSVAAALLTWFGTSSSGNGR